MEKANDIIANIIKNVLTALYQPFWAALLLVFMAMIWFRTILNRDIWFDPLSDVMGGWSLHDAEGKLMWIVAEEGLFLYIWGEYV